MTPFRPNAQARWHCWSSISELFTQDPSSLSLSLSISLHLSFSLFTMSPSHPKKTRIIPSTAMIENSLVCAACMCRSLRYSEKRHAWYIYHAADAKLKGRGKSILLYLPDAATKPIIAWRDLYRPLLVKNPHDFVFVNNKGERRKNLANVVSSVVARFPHIKSRGTAQGLRFSLLSLCTHTRTVLTTCHTCLST